MSEVNLSALTAEALNKSGVLWLRLAGGERLTWFAIGTDELDGQILLVSGGQEADLGPLPEQLEVVLRSKGDGGRLLTLRARAQELTPDNAWWDAAASALLGERLNAPPGLVDSWRAASTMWLLAPFGAPVQSPGHPGPEGNDRAAAPVTVGAAGTPVRRPWHLGGRGRRG
ncbi:hypothetical protein [Janibacter limosus]|uniref:hypothetical protein n=1 Tax=Janibacter limosus TaxID=53458 RepID=UPI00082CDD0A|nr:hypothetical protein [Janibacter limosus]